MPIAERVEKHHGVSLMPWRSWIDVVESFAADECDAFDRFLELALSWDDPVAPPPPVTAAPPAVGVLLEELAARPAMFLGEKSIFRLADVLRGYAHTIAAASEVGRAEVAELERFYGELVAQRHDHRGRPWFKLLRFFAHSDEAAFDEFFKQWRERAAPSSPR